MNNHAPIKNAINVMEQINQRALFILNDINVERFIKNENIKPHKKESLEKKISDLSLKINKIIAQEIITNETEAVVEKFSMIMTLLDDEIKETRHLSNSGYETILHFIQQELIASLILTYTNRNININTNCDLTSILPSTLMTSLLQRDLEIVNFVPDAVNHHDSNYLTIPYIQENTSDWLLLTRIITNNNKENTTNKISVDELNDNGSVSFSRLMTRVEFKCKENDSSRLKELNWHTLKFTYNYLRKNKQTKKKFNINSGDILLLAPYTIFFHIIDALESNDLNFIKYARGFFNDDFSLYYTHIDDVIEVNQSHWLYHAAKLKNIDENILEYIFMHKTRYEMDLYFADTILEKENPSLIKSLLVNRNKNTYSEQEYENELGAMLLSLKKISVKYLINKPNVGQNEYLNALPGIIIFYTLKFGTDSFSFYKKITEYLRDIYIYISLNSFTANKMPDQDTKKNIISVYSTLLNFIERLVKFKHNYKMFIDHFIEYLLKNESPSLSSTERLSKIYDILILNSEKTIDHAISYALNKTDEKNKNLIKTRKKMNGNLKKPKENEPLTKESLIFNKKFKSLNTYFNYDESGEVLNEPPFIINQKNLDCGYYASAFASDYLYTHNKDLFSTPPLPAHKSDTTPKSLNSLWKERKKLNIPHEGPIFSIDHMEKLLNKNECSGKVFECNSYEEFLEVIKKSISEQHPIIIPFSAKNSKPHIYGSAKSAHWATIIGWRIRKGKCQILLAQWGEYTKYNAKDLFLSFYHMGHTFPETFLHKISIHNKEEELTKHTWTKSNKPNIENAIQTDIIPDTDLSKNFARKLIVVYPTKLLLQLENKDSNTNKK